KQPLLPAAATSAGGRLDHDTGRFLAGDHDTAQMPLVADLPPAVDLELSAGVEPGLYLGTVGACSPGWVTPNPAGTFSGRWMLVNAIPHRPARPAPQAGVFPLAWTALSVLERQHSAGRKDGGLFLRVPPVNPGQGAVGQTLIFLDPAQQH